MRTMGFVRRLATFCVAMFGVAATAAEPWALWTDFTGADAEGGLAPQAASAQNDIDGGAWRFRLAGDASVDANGVLSTGTAAAPHIDFGANINLGYDNNPFTVVMAVRNVGATAGKPLCMAGSTIGTALATIDREAGAATIKGMWGNAVWNNGNNVARSVDTLAGTGVTVLSMSYSGAGVTVKTVDASGVASLDTWAGLKGSSYGVRRILFGNADGATSGGLDFELLAVAVYRGEPSEADLVWLADEEAVYTWRGSSSTFHNGPWKTSPRYACAEESGRSSTTWTVFADATINNQNSYVAPGRILRFAAPTEADGVFVGGLDAQFAPFNLGGLVVEAGATGYSFRTSQSSTRTLDLGDRSSSPRATAFVFHEDFAVNRVATGGQSDTTTFHGPVSVVIDAGKTFAISEEAAVASGASVTVSGGGTLALGKTLTMAGALTIEEGTLSIPNLNLQTTPVTLGANGALAVSGTLTLHDAPVRLASLPATIDLSAICSAPNATYDSLIAFTEGVTPDWGNVAFAWGDAGERPGFVTVTTDEAGLSVTVNRTEDNFIVMPMGDSITEGLGSTASYRKALAERMMAAGMSPRFVGARILNGATIANEDCRNHLGMSSHRVQTKGNRGGYLQGAPNWLEQAGYPDAVTLMIGTNDFQEAPETVFGQWKALVGTMAGVRPDTWLVVAPIIPPKTGTRPEVLTFAQAYNAYIESLFDCVETILTVNGEETRCVLGTPNAAGREAFGADAKIMMASMFAAIPVEGNAAYFLDNIHPNQAGYDRMAAVWLEAIKTLRGERGGLKDAEAIVDAYQTAGAMDKVTAVFNRQQRETEGVTVTVGGAEAEVSERTLSADGRRVTLTLAAPLADGAEVTVGKEALSRAFTAKGTAAESRVEAAQREGYVAVKALDLPEKGAFNNEAKAKAAFATLAGAEGVTAFDRLGYYVTLARPDGALRWLWVTMDRPAAYATVEALGLPTANLRAKVSNLRVASNVPGIEPVTEDGVQGLLQFGPSQISSSAADAEHPVSLGGIYDWNTAFGATAYGYGAMQVFRLYEEGIGRADSGMPASTLFSYSRWATESAGNDEITLGDLANHQGYDSGTLSAASLTSIFTTGFPTLNTTAYGVRRIEIWVRPTAARTWAGATEGTWDKAEASVWREGAPFADATAVVFGALDDGATAATVTVGEAVAPSVLTVERNAYTFTGAAIAADALTVAAGASATFESALSTEGGASVAGTLTVGTATFGQTPTGSGTLVKTGAIGENDLTLTLPASNVIPSYEVLGGKLTLVKSASGNGAAFTGGVPSFKVAPGAHLVWDSNDLVGWTRANTVTVAEVSGVLEKVRDANETFSGRLLLKDGGELRNGVENKFLLHSGAIVEVETNATASITGSAIRVNGGTPELKVGEGAELAVSAPLTIPGGIALRKSGLGKATLSGSVAGSGGGWGTLDVAEGTLKAALSGNLDATLTVWAGATLEMAGALGKGGLPATVNGRLVGRGKLFGTNGNGTLALGATGEVVAPAAGETLELVPGDGQAVTIAPGATFVAGAGTLLLTNGYAKNGEGAFAVALPEGVTLARGESLPVLTVGEGKALDAADFAAPQGLTCYAEGRTLFVANLLAVDRPEGEAEAWAPATLKAVTAAVNALGEAGATIARVTKVEAVTKGGTAVTTDVATVNDVLTCFQGGAVATANPDDPTVATVTVSYEFGVAAVAYEREPEMVSVTVRVRGAGTAPATFANGVSLEFFAAEGEGEPLATTEALPGSMEATVRFTDFPEWLTRPFKVRAVVR